MAQNESCQEKINTLDEKSFWPKSFWIWRKSEALSNAVCHKEYDVREPIEVRVEPDRIIIVSHPGADRSISQEGLREYRVFSRRYRNRRIGEFLKEMHLTEGRNTGFRKIRNALRNHGSPEPLFETDEERTSFATTLFFIRILWG